MKNKCVPEGMKIKGLLEHCNMMSAVIEELLENKKHNDEEIRYMREFLGYKNLEEEYWYFRKNAVEVYEDDFPFPHLTIKE